MNNYKARFIPDTSVKKLPKNDGKGKPKTPPKPMSEQLREQELKLFGNQARKL